MLIALEEGLYLTVVGMSAVAGVLCLLIFTVTVLNKLFPFKEQETAVEPSPASVDSLDETAPPVPAPVLMAVAVEHHRRHSGLGSELKAERRLSPDYLTEGRYQ